MQFRGIYLILLVGALPTLNLRAQAALDVPRIQNAIVEIQNVTRGAKRSASGIVISENGMVLTSQSIVPEISGTVSVRFCNGDQAQAKIVAADAGTESRLLQLPVRTAPYVFLELADSSHAAVGQTAFTAANSFEAVRDGQVALSVGVVSGAYTSENVCDESCYCGAVIETDAAVNPGSAGGALLDCNGRVLGMLSMSLDRTRRLGTAIPIHCIKAKLAALAELNLRETAPNDCPVRVSDAGKALIRVRRDASLATAGVLIDDTGLALTCAGNPGQALNKGSRVDVECCNGQVCHAMTVAVDLKADLALLRVELPAQASACCGRLALSDDADVRMGSSVRVLGTSGLSGVAFSATYDHGIVSAKDRIGGALQTDLKINAGNYGGPVLDGSGRMIGIVTHFNPCEDWGQANCGIGFVAGSRAISERLGQPELAHRQATAERDRPAVERLVERLEACVALIGDGSGVVVSPDGCILTCAHIADGQSPCRVQVGGTIYTADVLENDAGADLALLKVRHASGLPFAHLACADIEVGASVLAAGDPFKLAASGGTPAFSFGIVSALHRNQGPCHNVIQTDAAINPGNSGGPLFDLDGNMVGLNGQIRYRFQAVANTGIGFSTPCARICALLERHQVQYSAASH